MRNGSFFRGLPISQSLRAKAAAQGAVAGLGLLAWLVMPEKKRAVDDSDTDSSDSETEDRFEQELEELQDI